MGRMKDAMLDGDGKWNTPCVHPFGRRVYRYNDRETGCWLCRDCGFYSAPPPKPMTDEEVKSIVDALFGPEMG